ncbi:hypothetical protein [Anaeromicropila herbilytica]|uniref:Uncharacterized protein n=1 Tax=Anaeromicropila herbilytica TaxID=2785025 RepID=A0A7R7ENU6_9FIRM|nr:hypothetical protein [Anaeromicropila herbilytica]BCN32310.1 hypothetical protein bsdtb5_36050 [Anaeromicropila herbilytica]
MRQRKLCAVFLLLSLVFTGCNSNGESLSVGELKENTLLVYKEGNLQEGIVEDFDKSYYNQSTLEKYIEKEIEDYNTKAGKKVIKKKSYVVKGKEVKLILSYKDFKSYSKFNNITADYLTPEKARENKKIPELLVDAGDSSLVKKVAALKGDGYRVLILSDEYHVTVSGRILYYSNAALLNGKSVQTLDEEKYSVVVYKP